MLTTVTVEIEAYVRDDQPGWVRCRLVDALGRTHSFVEKVPIVTTSRLDATSGYPQRGAIRCTVVNRRRGADGRELITVDTSSPDGVESSDGQSMFEVHAEQVAEAASQANLE